MPTSARRPVRPPVVPRLPKLDIARVRTNADLDPSHHHQKLRTTTKHNLPPSRSFPLGSQSLLSSPRNRRHVQPTRVKSLHSSKSRRPVAPPYNPLHAIQDASPRFASMGQFSPRYEAIVDTVLDDPKENWALKSAPMSQSRRSTHSSRQPSPHHHHQAHRSRPSTSSFRRHRTPQKPKRQAGGVMTNGIGNGKGRIINERSSPSRQQLRSAGRRRPTTAPNARTSDLPSGTGFVLTDDRWLSQGSDAAALRVAPICGPLRLDIPVAMQAPHRQEHKLDQPDMDKHDLKLLGDFSVRAESCLRAERFRGQAVAYFCSAVLFDNYSQFDKAIACYRRFLALAVSLGDEQCVSLAYNCIATDYHLKGPQFWQEAAYCYTQQLQRSASLSAQFCAHTNLGLLHMDPRNTAFRSLDKAAVAHQHALRFAIRINSVLAQAIAIANIGCTAAYQRDWVTAKACTERHLQLCARTRDVTGQARALANLGAICALQAQDPDNSESHLDEACRHLEQAIRAAHVAHRPQLADQAKVHLGVVKGKRSFAQYMGRLRDQTTPKPVVSVCV